jgi:hypothetical protein
MLEDHKLSGKKFFTLFCLGLIAIFAFLLLFASNMRGTGTPIEYFDRIFYTFFALLCVASIAFSIEKK